MVALVEMNDVIEKQRSRVKKVVVVVWGWCWICRVAVTSPSSPP